MPDPSNRRLIVYQGKCSAFLAWSQPFIYRLVKSLEPHVRQVVLTQRVENADLFPMPEIERLNTKTLFSPFESHRAACRLQQKYHAHLIHAHFGYTAVKLALLKQMMRVPMVVTFGGKDLTVHAARPKTLGAYRCLFDVCEQLVAVSDDLRGRAVGIGCPHEKIRVIRRGIDLEEFRPVERGDRGDVGILMVSRLVPKKGHADAVAALASLPRDLPPWGLTVIGEGPEEPAVRQGLRSAGLLDRARFLGVVPIERVRREMADADILLHPSVTGEDGDKEGIPNVLIEGQATGLPILSTRHGGIPEVVLDGRSGLLVDEHDPDALARGLRRLIGDRRLRLQFGEAAVEHIRKDFALERQVRDYLDVYRELAERYPPDHPELTEIRTDVAIPKMLRESRAESGTAGDISISELLEDRFIKPGGDAAKGDPWWYEAFWRLKRYVPRNLKFRVKRLLYRMFPDQFNVWMPAQVRDEKVWAAMKISGIPDPQQAPRSLQDFLDVLAESDEVNADRTDVALGDKPPDHTEPHRNGKG